MVSPIVWVSLELSCSRVPQTRSIATFTSSATWRMKEYVLEYLCQSQQQQHCMTHKRLCETCLQWFFTSFSKAYLFLQLPVWYAEEIYFHCTVGTNEQGRKWYQCKPIFLCQVAQHFYFVFVFLLFLTTALVFTCRRVCCRCSGLSARLHTQHPPPGPASSAAPPESASSTPNGQRVNSQATVSKIRRLNDFYRLDLY